MFPIHFYLGSKIGEWLAKNGHFSELDSFATQEDNILKILKKRGLIESNPVNTTRAFSVHWPDKIPVNRIYNYEYFLNIHPGYLPIGRGTFPIFWAVFLKHQAGVSVHQITDKIDLGPILMREKIEFDESETAGQVWKRIHNLEKQLLQKSIDQLRNIEKLKMFNPVGEKIGINRKLVEFKSLVENQNIGSLTKYEKNRLRLALTHHDYELPSWIKRA